MEKIQLSEIEYNKTPISVGSRSKVYSTSKDKLLKVYDDSYLEFEKLFCVNTEEKILDSDKRDLPIDIRQPEVAFYDGKRFRGELVSKANGVSYAIWESQFSH